MIAGTVCLTVRLHCIQCRLVRQHWGDYSISTVKSGYTSMSTVYTIYCRLGSLHWGEKSIQYRLIRIHRSEYSI